MPRIPIDRVREGLLHPDLEVRRAALRYFTKARWPDPAVMGSVIVAIARYGRKSAFGYILDHAKLGQSADTLRWSVGELTNDIRTNSPDYCYGIAHLIAAADPELLATVAAEVLATPNLEAELAVRITHRLGYRTAEGEYLWAELEQLCRDNAAVEYGSHFPTDHAEDIVEALARQGDRHVAKAMELLAESSEDSDDPARMWLEIYATRLAGELRQESAVPLLLDKLAFDNEMLNEEAATALTRIGTDATVAAVRAAYPEAEWFSRLYMGAVFRDVHSDAALEKGWP